MELNLQSGPIIACSSSMDSNAALGVIRISGFAEISDLNNFFSCDLSTIEVRKATRADLISAERVVDNVILTYFKAPHSYTGENLLEISAHGNILNIKQIMEMFVERGGLSYALPGEFTFRAYKNKKLNLSQVEGLDLFLQATTPTMLDQGIQMLQGELQQKYQRLYENFLRFKSAIELSIDFLEDVGEKSADKELHSSFNSLKKDLEYFYKCASGNKSAVMSPTIAIIGKSNAGKSSLFNYLLSSKRSIVTNIAGTTRDFVSEYINFSGVDYRIVDTAGFRTSEDLIEAEGMEKAREVLKNAFFKVLVVDPFSWERSDLSLFGEQEFDLVVVSHKDCPGFVEKEALLVYLDNRVSISLASGSIGAVGESGSIGAAGESGSIGAAGESGSIGPGEIFSKIHAKYLKFKGKNVLLVDRQRKIFREAQPIVRRIEKELATHRDMGVMSSEATILGAMIQSLIGAISPDDVLSNIFDNFCIGK